VSVDGRTWTTWIETSNTFVTRRLIKQKLNTDQLQIKRWAYWNQVEEVILKMYGNRDHVHFNDDERQAGAWIYSSSRHLERTKSRRTTLEYTRWIFVTLILSSGPPDPVFKNKKIPFASTAIYHENYNKNMSHWAVWTLRKLLCTVMSYEFWWKVSRVSKVSYMPDTAKVSHMPELNYSHKNYGREELLLLYTANKTVEACTEWVSGFYTQNVL